MLSHSVLLVIGGALLTGILGALVFGSNGTAEDKRLREEQKLLRALEAQRRIRDAQLMREGRRRRLTTPVLEASPVSAEPFEPEPVAEDTAAEQRATERRRKRDEQEQAVALRSEREAEKRAERRAEQERKRAAKAQQATLRAAERQQKQEAKAALKAEQALVRAAKAQEQAKMKLQQAAPPSAPAPEPATAEDDEQAKPLSELPLFSWAHRIEEDDAPRRGTS